MQQMVTSLHPQGNILLTPSSWPWYSRRASAMASAWQSAVTSRSTAP